MKHSTLMPLLLVLLIAAACSDDDSTPTTDSAPHTDAGDAATHDTLAPDGAVADLDISCPTYRPAPLSALRMCYL